MKMGKIIEVTVTKGKTFTTLDAKGQNKWDRIEYSLKVDVSDANGEGDVEDVRVRANQLLDSWLELFKPVDSPQIEKTGLHLEPTCSNEFPELITDTCIVTRDEGGVSLKPKQFLGKERFNDVLAYVRGAGGRYLPAGKDSYFRIPKKRV